jgi:hypothetical protein
MMMIEPEGWYLGQSATEPLNPVNVSKMPTTNELLFIGKREIAVLGSLSKALRTKPDRSVKRRKRRTKAVPVMGGIGARLQRFLDLLEEEEDLESEYESALTDAGDKSSEVGSRISAGLPENTDLHLETVDDSWTLGQLEPGFDYADALSFVSAIVSGTLQKTSNDNGTSETCDKGTETDDDSLINGVRSVTIDCGVECVIEHPVVPPPFAPNSSPRLSSRARRMLVP